MNKLYFVMFLGTCFLGAYCIGLKTGKAKCRADLMHDVVQIQSDVLKTQEKIDEETVGRATADIRGFLCKKYTIMY